MKFDAKPLRSVLFVPGNKEDWIRKAPKYGADALILDIEDSVPPQEKDAAREIVSRMIAEIGAEQTLFVRVNPLETGITGFDLEAITQPNLYGITLPKVQCPADVVEVDVLLRFFERKAGAEVGQDIHRPGLGNGGGHTQRIRHRLRVRPQSRTWGGSGGKGGDTARSIGYQWTPEGMETLFIRSKVLVDSRAAGVQFPISGGWFDIRDLDGLRTYAGELKRLGYNGMRPHTSLPCAHRQRSLYANAG